MKIKQEYRGNRWKIRGEKKVEFNENSPSIYRKQMERKRMFLNLNLIDKLVKL